MPNADGITRVKKKNTKYFLNLEKRYFKNSDISQLKTGENEFATSDKEILHQCEDFYRDLSIFLKTRTFQKQMKKKVGKAC